MNIFNNGLKLSGSLIVAAFLSFFLCISMNVICSAAFTKDIGYNAYVYENENSEKLIAEYTYNYTDADGDGKNDGTDLKKQEYEDAGYNVITVKVRSTLTGVGKAVFFVSTQALNLILIIAFAGNGAYKQGFKDNNLVKIGQSKKDNLKGLKIGLIGNMPFFAIFIIAIVFACGLAPDFRVVWYAFFNSHYYPLIMTIADTAQTLSNLEIGQIILMLLLQLIVPAVSTVAYILGFKEINIFENLVYKKEGK